MLKKLRKIFRLKSSGYTMVEFMLTCTIVIALVTGAALGVRDYLIAGKYNSVKADLSIIAMAVTKYRFEIGTNPPTLAALTIAQGPRGPWITSEGLRDPWGENYEYFVNGDSFAIWSKGMDNVSQSVNVFTDGFSGDDIGERRE